MIKTLIKFKTPERTARLSRDGLRSGMAPLPSGRRVALFLALALAACSNADAPLPDQRIAVRPEEAPLAQTDAAAVRPVGLPAPVVNADWTHRNGAAGGRLVNPAFSPTPSLRWSVPIGEGDAKRRRILTGPIVAGGLVYTIDAAGQLSAVTRGGQIAWTQSLVPPEQIGDSGPGGGFSYANGVLYVTSGFGEVRALDPATGRVLWSQTFEGPIRAAPTVADGRVYVVARDDVAFALDARDGHTLWQARGVGGVGLLGGASPAVDGQLVVIPFASGEVLGLVPRNGLQIWGTAITGGRRGLVRSTISDISGDPVIDGATVYASNQGGRTVALDRATGERRWTMGEGAYGPAWPVGGSLFLMSDEGALVRADAATGRLIWSTQLPSDGPPTGIFRRGPPASVITHYGPLLAGGRLWVASGDGLLRSFDPSTGAQLGAVELPGGAGAPPAIAGGVLYVVNRDGQLLAFQ